MKALLPALLLFISFNAVSQEMPYFEGSLKELQQEAKKRKKPYFVDFYTDWCGYCKKMDATTFRDNEVIHMVKSNFVAYKINAEKGEGPGFTRKHGVSGFPTIKVFDYNGNEIGTIRGYANKEKFMAEMANYISTPAKSSTEHKVTYWAAKKPYFDQLDSGLKTFHPEWRADLDSAHSYGQSRAYFKFDELNIDAEIDHGKEIAPFLKLAFERGRGDMEQMKTIVHSLFLEKKLSAEELHYYALFFHQYNDVTIEVLQWINKVAITDRENINVLDSKAAIQLAYGDTDDAIETAREAKKIASKNKLDATCIDVILSEAKN